MKKLFNFLIKILGALTLLFLIVFYIGYRILFDDTMKYYPVEDPLVAEKLQDWQDRKFGLFMHWGPYSQWGVVESWSICAEDEPWCYRGAADNYVEYKKRYENLQKTFNPVDFDPIKWADAAKDAGMKYLVFTTKHHDGFCMFDTNTTNYKITDDSCAFAADPRSDVTREIFNSFRAEDFMIGAYFSKPDWNNEYFWWPNFATPDRNVNYNITKYPERWENFVDYTHTQVDELVSNYGNIDILWFDGGWVRPLSNFESRVSDFFSSLYYQAGYTQLTPPQNQDLRMAELADKVRKKQPGLIFVDRHIEGKEQDYMTPEQFVPDHFLPYPWESCITMAGGWSYSFNATYKPARQIIQMLVDVVSKGGNLLLNIGPGPDGTWDEEAYKRLEEIGDWMEVNKSAIYNTKGRELFAEDKFRFTYMDDGSINAIYLADENETTIPSELNIQSLKFKDIREVVFLGSSVPLQWKASGNKIKILIPDDVRNNPPCDYAWVFQLKMKD